MIFAIKSIHQEYSFNNLIYKSEIDYWSKYFDLSFLYKFHNSNSYSQSISRIRLSSKFNDPYTKEYLSSNLTYES